ncbi:MAG: hypothetical protein J5965_11240 [Aeriscardovia sp.]|nr:hypothetical protein [Aeriscardovia sp.]
MKLNEIEISQLFEECLVKVKKPINVSCSLKQSETDKLININRFNNPMPSKDIKIPAEYFKVLKIDGNCNCITIKFFNDYEYMWEQPVIEFDNVQLDDVCNEYNKKCFRNKEQNERNKAIQYIGDAIASAIKHYC